MSIVSVSKTSSTVYNFKINF